MSLISMGARCGRCRTRPVTYPDYGTCTACHNLEKMTGKLKVYEPVPAKIHRHRDTAPLNRFQALKDMGVAHDSDTTEFEQELTDLLSGELAPFEENL